MPQSLFQTMRQPLLHSKKHLVYSLHVLHFFLVLNVLQITILFVCACRFSGNSQSYCMPNKVHCYYGQAFSKAFQLCSSITSVYVLNSVTCSEEWKYAFDKYIGGIKTVAC
uniref:Uncharacterized protein n=1 Tax=Rhipicephalus microplus TaxID=6941 RepID=A0A6G5AFD5_RHIMP